MDLLARSRGRCLVAAGPEVRSYTIYYVVQPMPGALVVKQIAFDGILILINGVVAAAVYRKP